MFVIVPNALRDAINKKLDDALGKVPDAAPDREHFYQMLLSYYNDHGELPDFDLQKRTDR